jgi:TRAP-type C4-dicarboxylate transport system substrate-binding protein
MSAMIWKRYEMARWICAALVVTFGATACYGAPVTRVGAPTDAAVINLELASAYHEDELVEFVREVESRSGGRYQLEPHRVTYGSLDAEQNVIDEVRAGRADVGAVGARTMSALGVHTYEPLIAPLVVDSYDLQSDVLGDQQLVHQMGSGLDEVGLVAIGVFPGPLRYLASREPMARPSDFVGKRVAISKSAVAQDTFEELGATTGDIAAGQAIARFDAVESHLSAIVYDNYDRVRPFITADLALWPRSIVLFMTKERYEQLGAEGQALLRDAVSAGIGDATRRLKLGVAESLGVLCRRGQSFVASSPEDARSMREGVEPILERISSDATAKTILERIQVLKTSFAAAAPPRCGQTQPSSTPPSITPATTELDGRWQACPTVEDILAAGGEPVEARENAGCTTWTFHAGTFTESGPMAPSGQAGSYEVDGDMISVRRANGEEFVFRWSLFRGRLTFADPAIPGAISPAPVRAVPWERVAD